MKKINLDKKIKDIMANIFKTSRKNISNKSSKDTIKNWDSLKHLQLVIALEEEFGIKFTDKQTTEMLNFELIKKIIQEKEK
tara:strand:+ start:583 stop:825 length:243 start_codon:yes stop_codon:yes gene_type:complete